MLASAGIKYWAAGANQDRSVLAHEQWNDKSPFWWEYPDGQKVLFYYSWGYSQMSHFFTVEPTNALVYQSLPQVLALNNNPDYKPDAILVYSAQGENSEFHPQLASFAAVWNRAYAYPKLQLSTLTSAQKFDPVAVSRIGMESMQPPVLNALTNQDKVGNPNQPLPPEGTGFLDISAANVVLVTWKLAENGKGTILRLQETGGRKTEAAVHFSHTHFHSASLCNAVEDTLLPLAIANDRLHLTLRPYEVVTVRLTP